MAEAGFGQIAKGRIPDLLEWAQNPCYIYVHAYIVSTNYESLVLGM